MLGFMSCTKVSPGSPGPPDVKTAPIYVGLARTVMKRQLQEHAPTQTAFRLGCRRSLFLQAEFVFPRAISGVVCY